MVAQLGERLTEDQKAGCSSHSHRTSYNEEKNEVNRMGDTLYDVEVFQGTSYFLAKIIAHQSKEKPIREYKTNTLEELLENIAKDILEDNE